MLTPVVQTNNPKISDDLFRKKDWKLPNKLYIAFLAKMLRKNPKLYFLIFQFSSENVLLSRNHGILNKNRSIQKTLWRTTVTRGNFDISLHNVCLPKRTKQIHRRTDLNVHYNKQRNMFHLKNILLFSWLKSRTKLKRKVDERI